MSSSLIHNLDAATCRTALSAFWSNVCEIEPHDKGLAFAMPVLLSDGWQVALYAEEEIPGHITLRDRGQMHSWLHVRQVNVDSEQNKAIIHDTMKRYGVETDALGFCKVVRLPMAAKELQLFACFLSSVSYLTLRVQKQSVARWASYSSVMDIAEHLKLPYKERVAYLTQHRKLTVDLTISGLHRSALVQTFDQQGRTAVDAMELWSARLPEIAATDPDSFVTALVYNEDVCDISPDVLAVASGRGNFVCPSHRNDELEDFFASRLVG